MSARNYGHDNGHDTHVSVPGAWWFMRRELPCLTGPGTYYVTVGYVGDGFPDDKFQAQWRTNFGAVVDDFGNLVRVS